MSDYLYSILLTFGAPFIIVGGFRLVRLAFISLLAELDNDRFLFLRWDSLMIGGVCSIVYGLNMAVKSIMFFLS